MNSRMFAALMAGAVSRMAWMIPLKVAATSVWQQWQWWRQQQQQQWRQQAVKSLP
jgi:hypothetical protein